MDTHYHTPSWMSGLLVIFSLALTATLGLFLYRHGELAALEEQHSLFNAAVPNLRSAAGALDTRILELDQEIARRREKLPVLADFEATNRGDIERLVTLNGAATKATEDAMRKEIATYTDLMKEAPERRAEVGKEEERLFASQRDNDERRRVLRTDVESQSQALEIFRKKSRSENFALDLRVSELEARVRQLTSQIDSANRDLTPDGTILASAATDGFVVIDRGFQHNAHKGMKFTVYTRRGGRNILKGQIQVVAVEERISTCRVGTEADLNDPFIAGDLLHNPVYDPERQRGFAVRGEFTRFSPYEIGRFVAQSGARVDSTLTVDTDYLVAGANSDKDIELATKLGINIISEDQLLDFVQAGQVPDRMTWDFLLDRCRSGATFALVGDFNLVPRGTVMRALESQGGKISNRVEAGIAAVVVGDDALAAMTAASALGIFVIDQEQFRLIVESAAGK